VQDPSERLKIALPARVAGLPPYVFGQLNELKYRKRVGGADIIDLGMGNPNDPPPEPVVQKLCEAVQDKKNHRYSDLIGVFNLRREVARRYAARYGVEVDAETEVACTIGSKEGFSHVCLALLQERDVVVVPSPHFPVHVHGPNLAGATVLTVPLGEPEDLLRELHRACVRTVPRPKMMVLNFPHNPTAQVVEPDFFVEVVRIARRSGTLVVHDFAYGATAFDGYEPPSFLQAPGAREVGVEFTTMSKEFNMAGWRVGYCVGHAEVVAALKRIKGYYDYGIFQPIQIASIIALRHCAEEARGQARTYQRRRDVLCNGLDRIGWPTPRPRASMFCWVPVPEPYRAMGSVKLAFEMMEKAEVAVAPGAAFGEGGEGFLRLALVENEQRLRQAVRQIGRAFPGGERREAARRAARGPSLE